MTKKSLTFLTFVLSVLLGISLFWNYRQYRDSQGGQVKVEIKTVTKYIEKKDSMPEPKEERVIGTIKVPVPGFCKDTLRDSGNLFANTLPTADSLELERTQKVYADSSYTAYVSGYEPCLDSIFVMQKETATVVTETRTVKEKKFRRWNVGIIGGYGFGFKNKDFEPFVGVGVTFSLF